MELCRRSHKQVGRESSLVLHTVVSSRRNKRIPNQTSVILTQRTPRPYSSSKIQPAFSASLAVIQRPLFPYSAATFTVCAPMKFNLSSQNSLEPYALQTAPSVAHSSCPYIRTKALVYKMFSLRMVFFLFIFIRLAFYMYNICACTT